MKIYKENIKRFNDFFGSDYYHLLQDTDSTYIEKFFECLNIDPDSCDDELYRQLGEKLNLDYRRNYLVDKVGDETVKLSADIICGRKQLSTHYKNDYEKWILDYELIRSNIDLHFVWPKHKSPTINTYRYTKYLDRIDCLLFDLKLFFEGDNNTPMSSVYLNTSDNRTTYAWLKQFNDFPQFIEKLQLRAWVDDNYNVLDISSNQKKTLTTVLSRDIIETTISDYMKYLIELTRKGSFNLSYIDQE
ncbi:DUF6994 family protein [Streptococcus loxodontisalivarius]|uniref:Uncharacterized protein n=1 Tax=Streptococcus loxodontisalivarius TaxID=1349415 RepID=A0ABS2PQJ5_9STRE|nr:hypothetical protein [Streptococcus loxodontisalivarius]MBM7642313.1 hypothetical protein [Streptococcus loxodontisalivarius]